MVLNYVTKNGMRYHEPDPPPDSAPEVVPPPPMSSIRTSYWREFARSRWRCVFPILEKNFFQRWIFGGGERAFNKLARTFAAQVETLKRYRDSGEQRCRAALRQLAVGVWAPE
jgi:hypothetical protein